MDIRKTHELYKRLAFTILIVLLYLIGRSIPLFGIETDLLPKTDAQSIMNIMFSGDRYQITIMALGIMPYINASLIVQVVTALRSQEARAKISKQKQDQWMFIVALFIAVFMAFVQSQSLNFKAGSLNLNILRMIAALEMFCGAMFIFFLCDRNEKFGIGLSMPIILVNIITTLSGNLSRNHFLRYPVLFIICGLIILITLYFENSIIKIPLQRVSIHNIHADKNYMAYKRNPVGIMPVMFASSAFLLPQYLFRFLHFLFPKNKTILLINRNMTLNATVGIVIYLILIFLLSLLFSFIMLNPNESARQLRKNGDSIIGIYAGRKTRNYLVFLVLNLSIKSGLLQCACMAIPLIMSYFGRIPHELAMLPSTAMILVSIISSLVQEIMTYFRYDAYRFFL
jgi:preprotein translocase subunit SecY